MNVICAFIENLNLIRLEPIGKMLTFYTYYAGILKSVIMGRKLFDFCVDIYYLVVKTLKWCVSLMDISYCVVKFLFYQDEYFLNSVQKCIRFLFWDKSEYPYQNICCHFCEKYQNSYKIKCYETVDLLVCVLLVKWC